MGMGVVRRLDLSTNQLYSLPDSFGKLATLSKLDVSANKLTMLPPSMGHLKGTSPANCHPPYEELCVSSAEWLKR
jgi:Leucine-rich repeat (LRR) protein